MRLVAVAQHLWVSACGRMQAAARGFRDRRALEELFMAKGARIGYWRGSITGLIDDIQARSRPARAWTPLAR